MHYIPSSDYIVTTHVIVTINCIGDVYYVLPIRYLHYSP